MTTFEDALSTLPAPWQKKVLNAMEENRNEQGTVDGAPLAGLHCLMYWKLRSGLMRDLADVMELCKCHLDIVEPERVLMHLDPNDELRQTFLDILKKAPLEIAGERRLGQGNPQNYRQLKDS